MNKDKAANPQKVERVVRMKELLDKAKSVAVVDYKGMTVSQATQLRSDIKKVGGEMKVEKNTLFKIALGNKDIDIKGLSAFVMSNLDEISALKVVADFIKKNNILSFKLGVMGNKIISADEVSKLAATPSRETSISKVLYLLNWNMGKLARTLDAIAKKGVN